MAKKDGTKLCKHCKTEIPAAAKVCPNCRRKQGGVLKWILIVLVVFVIIGALAGGNESSPTSSTANSGSTDTKESETKQVEYTVCSVNDMMSALDNNAMSASDTYKDKYLEVTGRLGNIDSSGKYITLYTDDEFAITGVQCYIQNDEQKEAVKKMSTGSTVTLQGKCTDVGEVMGYSLKIDKIL